MLAPSSFHRWRDWVGMATPTSTSAARAAVAEKTRARVNSASIIFFMVIHPSFLRGPGSPVRNIWEPTASDKPDATRQR